MGLFSYYCVMKNRSKDQILTKKVMPFWLELFLTICVIGYFSFVSYLVYSVLTENYFPFWDLLGAFSFFAFFLIIWMFTFVSAFKFNLTNLSYKKIRGLGPIKYGRWKSIPTVEYVSVFCQLLSDGDGNGGSNYNVNLWHEGNKHFTIHTDFFAEPAFELAHMIATKLGVDLLDATDEDPDNYEWIKLDEAKIDD